MLYSRINSSVTVVNHFLQIYFCVWMNSYLPFVGDFDTGQKMKQKEKSNNHSEGWHNRLDKNAGGSKLRFYRLLQLLMEEADCTISRCFDYHFRLKLDKQNILVTTPAVDTLEQFLKALMYVRSSGAEWIPLPSRIL
ncbi:hypothetical protein T01_11301 [Trichinella spiralis]|uniref:Uncharacterized protein n=1 Tax=Trichinella spiralis TaxID=6334 RepID=A0A0V1BDX1_TRISP|nr:hypothetical protein T01_11301 [Trichinella spiralis]